MSGRNFPDLWARHQTTMVYIGAKYSIDWASSNRVAPLLQQAALKWFEESCTNAAKRLQGEAHDDPFANTSALERAISNMPSAVTTIARDLLPQKVGVVRMMPSPSSCFQIIVRPASWAEGVVCRRKNVEGQTHEPERIKMLAVTGLVHTADHRYVLGRRSLKGGVSSTAGAWHVTAAGYCDLAPFMLGGIWTCLEQELLEEANLRRSQDVSRTTTLGFSDHHQPESGHVEASILLETELVADEVIKRGADAKDRHERDEYRAFTRGEALELLRRDKFNPAGAATLMMALGV